MTTSLQRPRAMIVALLAFAAVAGGGFMFWSHEHAPASHDHHAAHTAVNVASAPSLDGGQRWSTDDPLRTGMRRIRDVARPVLLVHGRAGISPPQAAVLSSAIQEQVRYITSNCQLAPKPDAVLHGIITDLVRGAGLLVQDVTSAEGVTLVAGALRRYPEYFDHPGWTADGP